MIDNATRTKGIANKKMNPKPGLHISLGKSLFKTKAAAIMMA